MIVAAFKLSGECNTHLGHWSYEPVELTAPKPSDCSPEVNQEARSPHLASDAVRQSRSRLVNVGERRTAEGSVKLALIILTVFSAACELFGTLTVWVNYNRTSQAAMLVLAEMSRARRADEDYLANVENRTLDFINFKRDVQAERAEKNFVLTAFTNAMSPLQTSRLTKYGLWAYAIGAVLGLVVALIAL
jgi:hypothetical protein